MQEFVFPHSSEHVEHEFDRFKSKHGKDYRSSHEHENRKNIFRQNLRFIHSKNRAGLSYSLGINHLADRTAEELKALRGFKSSNIYNGGKPFPYDVEKEKDHLPDQHDWRLFGAVTPVKDQSVCGSCWSFGTVGALEGAYFLSNGGNLVRLSQQALIDCSWGYGKVIWWAILFVNLIDFIPLQRQQRLRWRWRFPCVPVDDEGRWHSNWR